MANDKKTTREGVLPLLGHCLNPAIVLEQDEIAKRGGVTEEDLKRVASYGQVLAEKGDQLLYKSKETADVFVKAAEAIAVLSFCPGGITIFGHTYIGNKFLERYQQKANDND